MFDRKLDLDFTTDVATPHFAWAKPLTGGPLRAAMVPNIRQGREISEMMQRFDLDLSTVTVDREWDLNKWGIGDYYRTYRAGCWDFELVYQNLENMLCSDEEYEVMVLPGLNGWGAWSRKAQEAILRRVKAGTGLVIMRPMHGLDFDEKPMHSPELEELSPLVPLFSEGYQSDRFAGDGFPGVRFDLMKRDTWEPGAHAITDGVPFELLPFDHMAYYPYEAAGEVILRAANGDPIAATKRVGKGRVVAFGYYSGCVLPQHADFSGRENFYESVTDNLAGSTTPTSYNFQEYAYQLIFNAMAWAAGRELTRQDEAVHSVFDAYDNLLQESSGVLALQEPMATLGGDLRVHTRWMQGGAVTGFAACTLNVPKAAWVDEVALDKEFYVKDGVAVITGRSGGQAKTVVTVSDDWGRDLAVFEQEDTGEFRFEYTIRDPKAVHLSARAEVVAQGYVIDRKDTTTAVVAPGDKRFVDDYEVFMNSQNRGWGQTWATQRKLTVDVGITAAFPGSNKLLSDAGASGLGIYWYHRHPYVERKEKWLTTRDKKFLVRLPCLNDPEFWARNEAAIAKTVAINGRYQPVSYYANDEGSLTCYTDDLELCHCPHCYREMRVWLKEKYGTLEALNVAWERDYTDWEQVEPDTFDEAYDRHVFGSWGDHRLFMERTFTGAYKRIREGVQAIDPDGVIRMSGCQASTTYTGYDYYLLHRQVGYFEAYGGGNQMELHRSFKDPRTMVGCWLGYGSRGVPVQFNIWYALLHGLIMNSIFCEWSMLNPDFTYYQGALDMAVTFKEIRRNGIGKLLLYGAKRDNCGIAVLDSMPSFHASYAQNYHRGLYESNRANWINVLEDSGYQYDFLSTHQVDAGELSCFKVIILPMAAAMSQKTVAAIEEFARKGGMVIADCHTAVVDDNCAWLPKGQLDDVFGIVRHTTRLWRFNSAHGDFPNPDFPYFDFAAEEDAGLPLSEIAVRCTTGIPALLQDFSRIIPALIVNKYNDGWGIYLNSHMDAYEGQREQANAPLRLALQKVLGLIDLAPPVTLTTPEGVSVFGGVECIHYTAGDVEYFAAQRGLATKLAYDGRTETVEGGDDTQVCVAHFAKPRHLYNLRTGKYYGLTDAADITLAPGEVALIAALPAKVNAVGIQGPATAKRGQRVAFALDTQADATLPGVLSFSLYDASGEYVFAESRNLIAPDGTTQADIFLPYNAPTGTWRAVVRNAATGHEATVNFDVE